LAVIETHRVFVRRFTYGLQDPVESLAIALRTKTIRSIELKKLVAGLEGFFPAIGLSLPR
jgi:hypothetical protein